MLPYTSIFICTAKADMVAPSFIDRIENVTVQEGEPVHFTCKVNGLPPPQVNWQKDGNHIRPGHASFQYVLSISIYQFLVIF